MALIKNLSSDKSASSSTRRSYTELCSFLDKHWEGDISLARAQQLDQALGSPSKNVTVVLVDGTLGKSLTIQFAAHLLRTEGLSVGAFSSPHILSYSERIAYNGHTIEQNLFTELAHEVLSVAEAKGIKVHSLELLTIMALKYFAQRKADVILIEVARQNTHSLAGLFHPLITAITKTNGHSLDQLMNELVKKDTWFVTSDTQKDSLIRMKELTTTLQGNWAMPVRKAAPLAYPYSQLHGKCAALAERIAHLVVDAKHTVETQHIDSLLGKKRNKRGRPTNEEKERLARKKVPSLEELWQDYAYTSIGRFDVRDTEHPCVILDTSSTQDALSHVLLGIRLLHYKRHFKGCALIVAAKKQEITPEFTRLLKGFFSKMSGVILVCPLEQSLVGTGEDTSWNVSHVTNALKAVGLPAYGSSSLTEALDLAKQRVDKKNGVVCITGSRSVVHTYLTSK